MKIIYISLRVKEGYEAIDFDEAMEKVSSEEAEVPIIPGQNENNRAFWGEKRRVYWSTSCIDLWIS